MPVLLADVSLAEQLPPGRRKRAIEACVAPTVTLDRGAWHPAALDNPDPGGFGLLILSGFITREVGQRARFGAEVLGPGDLLRPWQDDADGDSIPVEPVWITHTSSTLAVLGASFSIRAARYPEIAAELAGRALMRSRRLALTLAIVQQPRVDTRLAMLFWHLADRWGRVGPDAIALDLPLTHELLAKMVAARRPSVSAALSSLAEAGVIRRNGRQWLLFGTPPAELREIAAPEDRVPSEP